jgi:hypothetical protein
VSKRAEWNFEQEVPSVTTGTAEIQGTDDDHGPHVFLYVPDISERTGWSTHRVPERTPERVERRVGFRR